MDNVYEFIEPEFQSVARDRNDDKKKYPKTFTTRIQDNNVLCNKYTSFLLSSIYFSSLCFTFLFVASTF